MGQWRENIVTVTIVSVSMGMGCRGMEGGVGVLRGTEVRMVSWKIILM